MNKSKHEDYDYVGSLKAWGSCAPSLNKPNFVINKGDYIDAREFTRKECEAFIDLAVECGHRYGEGMEYFRVDRLVLLGVSSKLGSGYIRWGNINSRSYGFNTGNNITDQFRDYLNKENTVFTKDDLRDGMTVVYRNGEERIVLHDCLLRKEGHKYITTCLFSEFNNNLTSSHSHNKTMEIMTVKDRDGNILWRRQPETVKVTLELTPEQADSIKKQFGIE